MKYLLLLTSILWVSSTFCQEKLEDILPLKNNIVTYSGIIDVENTSKDELFKRAKRWFVLASKSAKDVIQMDDKENGELIGKATFKVEYFYLNPYILHTITILVKDSKFKYQITDFSYSDNQNTKFSIEHFPKMWAGKKKLYTRINEAVEGEIASIKKQMTSSESSEW